MNKMKTCKRFALLLSLIMIFSVMVQTTFGFIVTKTQPVKNTFTPIQRTIGNLIINKIVEHPFNADYIIPEDIEFDFEVNLGTFYANTAVSTTCGEKVANENGVITVTTKPGTSVGIQGIDEGTQVTVTEVQKEDDGFRVKDNVSSKKVTISDEQAVSVDYINVYEPAKVQPLNISVGGEKVLEGREWQVGDTFSFLLEKKEENNTWKSLGTKTVTYDAANAEFNKFDFTDVIQALTFDKVGEYSLRISEVEGSAENVDYDKTFNYFTVEVSDEDMDGKLEIGNVTGEQNTVVTKENENYSVYVTFNNVFKAQPTSTPTPKDIKVNINVEKTVKNIGAEKIGPENFKFVLENTATAKKVSHKTNAKGLTTFSMTYTEKDIGKTYNYRLTEVNDGREGVTYSNKVYRIKVAVKLDENNKLVSDILCNGKPVKKAVAEFENIYNSDTQVNPPATPPTGDNTNVLPYILMVCISGIVLIVLFILKIKRKR